MINLVFLEFEEQARINLSACEIVWHGILMTRNIGYPIKRVYVVDAEEIQAVYTEPNVLKWALFHLAVFVVQCTIAHTDIGSLVCWCTE